MHARELIARSYLIVDLKKKQKRRLKNASVSILIKFLSPNKNDKGADTPRQRQYAFAVCLHLVFYGLRWTISLINYLKSITLNLGNVHIYESNIERTKQMLSGQEDVKFDLNV